VTENVECHAGSSYPERPIAFWWQAQRHEVEECLSGWHSPGQRGFSVRTKTGDSFLLVYDEGSNDWRISPID
jgi:hypothetical protein